MPSIANYLLGQGAEGVPFQALEQCFKSFQARKRYNEITFTTEEKVNGAALLGRGGHVFDKLPLIIWLDRAKVEAVGQLHQPSVAVISDDHYMDLLAAKQALDLVRIGGALRKLNETEQEALSVAFHTLDKFLSQ